MNVFEKHEQWADVKSVCAKLVSYGHKAWLAGGCVRDLVLSRKPKDFDIVTDANPDQIQNLFPRSLEVGKKFGIIILPCEGFQIEVATFRKDGDYKDGRHPESISFATPEEDARRRDFTINALFFDPAVNRIIDFVNGQKDIQKKIIRTVGDPYRRFFEDKLRVLRAFRFVSQLNFALDRNTFLAAGDFSLEGVSKERIHDELNRILQYPGRLPALALLEQAGVIQKLWSQISVQSREWTKGKMLLFQLENDLKAPTYWAASLMFTKVHEDFTKSFKFSNEDTKLFHYLLKRFKEPSEFLKLKKSERLLTFAEGGRDQLRAIFYGFVKVFPETKNDWRKIEDELPKDGSLPEPFIGAQEIMSLGVSGEKIGKLLKSAYNLQLDGDLKSRLDAIAWLKNQI